MNQNIKDLKDISDTLYDFDSSIDSWTGEISTEWNVTILPKGYFSFVGNQNRIYSSILNKYIDAKTGEVINE